MTANNEQQKKLAAELAVALSQFMQQALPHDTDAHGFVFHSFQNPFDENCNLLWSLGVAWAAYGDSQDGFTPAEWKKTDLRDQEPVRFRFTGEYETRAAVLACDQFEQVFIERLLKSYLLSMVDYSWKGAQLDVRREPFKPEQIFHAQIAILIECGYLQRTGDAVMWTDLIAPAMQANGYWTSDAQPVSPRSIILPPASAAHVKALIQAGQSIAAISELRALTGCTLTQAKAWIVANMAAGS